LKDPVFSGANAMTAPATTPLDTLFKQVADKARAAAVFGDISSQGQVLDCAAKASGAPASYRLSFESGKVWVSLVTQDRWLSQSIEADLMHTGDKLEDLLGEELADLGYLGAAPSFEHFRSEDKLFTFRSIVPMDMTRLGDSKSAETAAICLLAYEACFRRLGDMDTTEE
jgi:hypothetical protein